MVKDEFHAPFEVVSRPERECTVVNVEALEDLVGGECFLREHCGGMAADFSLDHVVIAGSHNSEDGDGLFLPNDF